NKDTSVILSFINIAAKYRFIFIEEDSPWSVEAFYLERDSEKIKAMTNRLMRELFLIEEEARNNKLDDGSAITKYFGTGETLRLAKELQHEWLDARNHLETSADRLLRTETKAGGWELAVDDWLSALESFRASSEEINSIVTIQSLENPKKSFLPRSKPLQFE